ncbi:hypothetical protein KX816_05105 [Sphingosinicellaceae bacterium]|nr:hypothetical protein KX816_05105 [Sphingosinicellaceae bacterium]
MESGNARLPCNEITEVSGGLGLGDWQQWASSKVQEIVVPVQQISDSLQNWLNSNSFDQVGQYLQDDGGTAVVVGGIGLAAGAALDPTPVSPAAIALVVAGAATALSGAAATVTGNAITSHFNGHGGYANIR